MSPFTFSLPDMKSIWPDCLPESMSSQAGAAIWSVRLGLGADPAFTVQVPSLMTACQCRRRRRSRRTGSLRSSRPPCRHGTGQTLHRTSPSLSASSSPWWHRRVVLEGEEVHSPRHGEHGAGDVPRPLRAEEQDGVGDVLGLTFPL